MENRNWITVVKPCGCEYITSDGDGIPPVDKRMCEAHAKAENKYRVKA